MPKKRFCLLTNTGMTLVELAIATTIFAIAITPLFVLLNRTLKEVMFHNRTTVATRLAQDLMEEILNMPKWDEQADPGKAITPVSGATATGLFVAEANFDDIDDYHVFVDTQVAGSNTTYYRAVTVEYVTVPNAGDVILSAAGAITDFKRINVIVTWDQLSQAGRNPVAISAIAANINKY